MTGTERAIGPADDGFHFDTMSERWWETETCWFSFYEPRRALGGWLYAMVRPNIGTVAGGCWIWDPSAHLPWEALYNANYTCLRLPQDADLRNVALPTGVSITALEPLHRYRLGYEDGDRVRLQLEFEAVMAPVALASSASGFGSLGHFDQFGRVHGELVLHGERIAIDCLSMRDRSWGPRPEHRPKRSTYVTGMSDPGNGFLAMTDPDRPGEPITHGFLLRDGVVHPWAGGTRRAERSAQHGWTESLTVEGHDAAGRKLRAHGRTQSRIVINRHTFIDVNSLVRWDLDGRPAWGEDQDCWPVHAWAAHRRAGP